MKITKKYIQKLINEEVEKILKEAPEDILRMGMPKPVQEPAPDPSKHPSHQRALGSSQRKHDPATAQRRGQRLTASEKIVVDAMVKASNFPVSYSAQKYHGNPAYGQGYERKDLSASMLDAYREYAKTIIAIVDCWGGNITSDDTLDNIMKPGWMNNLARSAPEAATPLGIGRTAGAQKLIDSRHEIANCIRRLGDTSDTSDEGKWYDLATPLRGEGKWYADILITKLEETGGIDFLKQLWSPEKHKPRQGAGSGSRGSISGLKKDEWSGVSPWRPNSAGHVLIGRVAYAGVTAAARTTRKQP